MNYDPIHHLAQIALKDQGFYSGKLDGLWGVLSQRAVYDWEEDRNPETPSDHDSPLDDRTLRNIATLKPEAQTAARTLMAALWTFLAPKGYNAVITSGSRTYAEQDALYAQGRTKPGPEVTKARAGYSWHNFGIAWDITLFKDGKPVWDSPLYLECAKIGRDQGLDCGAFWTSFKDEPHYQLKTGKTLAEMRYLES